MNTMAEIAEEADKIFHEMFTANDILKGNSIEMHKEAWNIAHLRSQAIWSVYTDGFEMNSYKLTHKEAVTMKDALLDEDEYENVVIEPTYIKEAVNV